MTTETGAYSFPRLPVGTYTRPLRARGLPAAGAGGRPRSPPALPREINASSSCRRVQETVTVSGAVADRRHQADDHGRDLHGGHAAEHSDRARSVGAARTDAGRGDEPAERRRQQVGTAVHVHRARHADGQLDLERRRRHHHRHGRHRLLVGLLRLRFVPGDQLHHRRRRRVGADRRRQPELHHQERRQHAARIRAASSSRTTTSNRTTSPPSCARRAPGRATR